MKLLQRERELAEVAELVGTESLQDAERLVLETARLLREGFLRQSAYDPADATCPPGKTFEMLRLFLEWHRQRRGGRRGRRAAPGDPRRGARPRLLRLAQVPADAIRAAAEGLRAELAAALERLEAE